MIKIGMIDLNLELGGAHELLDRISVIHSQFEDFILEHPTCVAKQEFYIMATKISDMLAKLYQEVGNKHLGK